MMRDQAASPGARILVALIHAWIRARFHVEVHGLEHFTGSPSTLVVSNHRRDADGPIIGTGLLQWMDDLGIGAAPWFVAREDLFRRGFLQHYLTEWPSPVRALFSRLNLRPVLEMLHLYPIRRIRERTLGEVLVDMPAVLGDLPLAEVLRPPVLEQFRRQTPSGSHLDRVSDALHPRYRHLLRQQYGLTKLTRMCFRRLKPHEEATIGNQLRRFVDLLDDGAVLLLEPEGAISADGSLGRLRLGLHILLNRPHVPVRVLPVGIVYDFMTRGRPWVFVHIGHEIGDLGGRCRRETSARVTDAMLSCSTMTTSLLASRWLLTVRSCGGGYVTRADVDARVSVTAKRCVDRGLHVDPRLLDDRQRSQRISDYLAYCGDRGMIVPSGRRYLVPKNGRPTVPGWAQPDGALDYVHNQLRSLGLLWSELAGDP